MHWTVEQLLEIINKSGTNVHSIEMIVFGDNNNTIRCWKSRKRKPDIDTLNKVLNELGYKLAIVRSDTNGQK